MRSNARIVSFSGIDGAGKSTQIDELLRSLESTGYKPNLYTFWDDVVALSRFRETASLCAFKGDAGVGRPERPIARRDKNVSSWYVTAVRLLLYLLDACGLRFFLWRGAAGSSHLTIFDRYIYDELANLPLHNRFICWYVRALLTLVPKPDSALVLDADPEAASRRKPEYPLEFVRRNRDAYLKLAQIAALKIVPPGTVERTAEAIRKDVFENCLRGCMDSASCRPRRTVSPSISQNQG